jgi:hypothetical protein
LLDEKFEKNGDLVNVVVALLPRFLKLLEHMSVGGATNILSLLPYIWLPTVIQILKAIAVIPPKKAPYLFAFGIEAPRRKYQKWDHRKPQ